MENNEGRQVYADSHLIPKQRQAGETTAAYIIVSASLILIVGIYGWSTVAELFLSAVLGIMVDRLCLVCEERNHLATRYVKSWKKMLASCFSGIEWVSVSLTVLLAVAVLYVAERVSIATILATSLIVPLVRWFTSNTQSQVEVSRILEDNEKSVANGLAWSFYFGYLEIILPGLKERIRKQTQDWPFKLSSERLFILLPLDCTIRGKIEDADRNITAEPVHGNIELVLERAGLSRPYKNKVHCIQSNGETYRVLLEFATPLDTLRKMSISAKIKALGETEMIEQVRLFCHTLQGSILENPLNVDCQGKCELVIYDAKMVEEQGKSLAGLLVERIKKVEGIVEEGLHGDAGHQGVSRVAKEGEVLRFGEEEEPSLPTRETSESGDTMTLCE